MVLSTPSVGFMNLNDYMKSLYKLRDFKFDQIYLSHSVGCEDMIVDAKSTINRYIQYRIQSE